MLGATIYPTLLFISVDAHIVIVIVIIPVIVVVVVWMAMSPSSISLALAGLHSELNNNKYAASHYTFKINFTRFTYDI